MNTSKPIKPVAPLIPTPAGSLSGNKTWLEKNIEYELSNAYGVEYKLVGNTLKDNEKITSEIQKQITLKKAEILLKNREEAYQQALSREGELYAEVNEQEYQRNKALNDLNDTFKNKIGITYEKYLEALDKQRKGIKLTKEEEEGLNNYKKVWGSAADRYTQRQIRNYEKQEEAYKKQKIHI